MKRKADARLTKIAEASVNQQADAAWIIAAADLGEIVLGKSADSGLTVCRPYSLSLRPLPPFRRLASGRARWARSGDGQLPRERCHLCDCFGKREIRSQSLRMRRFS